MQTYNFDEFLRCLSELGSYEEVLREAEETATAAERAATDGHKGVVQARESGALAYSRRIGDFLFFMRYGRRPAGIDNEEFQKYRVVVESLVDKEKMLPSAMQLFQGKPS